MIHKTGDSARDAQGVKDPRTLLSADPHITPEFVFPRVVTDTLQRSFPKYTKVSKIARPEMNGLVYSYEAVCVHSYHLGCVHRGLDKDARDNIVSPTSQQLTENTRQTWEGLYPCVTPRAGANLVFLEFLPVLSGWGSYRALPVNLSHHDCHAQTLVLRCLPCASLVTQLLPVIQAHCQQEER